MPEQINWQIQKPEVVEKLIERLLKESGDEAKADKIEQELYPLSWEERHKF